MTTFSIPTFKVEARRLAVVEQINRITEAKMKQLNIQLATIQAEKEKVRFPLVEANINSFYWLSAP